MEAVKHSDKFNNESFRDCRGKRYLKENTNVVLQRRLIMPN